MAKLWWCFILSSSPFLLWGDQGELDRLVAESTRVRSLTPDFSELTRQDWKGLQTSFRSWLESRLPNDAPALDVMFPKLEGQLKAELRSHDLLQPDKPEGAVGYVSALKLIQPSEYRNAVIVQAGISVPCGSDDSWYLYHFTLNGKQRILEANGSSKHGNEFVDSQFSSLDRFGNRLLYLSWDGVQCASVWNGLEYRVLRLNPEADHAQPVLSGDHTFVIDDDPAR